MTTNSPYTTPTTHLDLDAIRKWTAANLRARHAYRLQPNSSRQGAWSLYGRKS